MTKIKCTISYDGTNFSGYQIQPNKRTVQQEIERAIAKIHKGKQTRIYSSGRTDAGVHACGQVFHFETDLTIVPENWKKALNALLPDDIYVHKAVEVDTSFHARFSACAKEYRYLIQNTSEIDIFKRNYRYFTADLLDVEAMQEACKVFEGTHDFTAFSSARSTVKGDKIRTLYEVTCNPQGEEIEFVLRGNGFLYHMVRIIVGVLLDVGRGYVKVEEIQEMFAAKDRKNVGKTLPPNGLFLWQVTYE